MLRVLQVVGGLARGGIESVIMRFYRQIDLTQIQFDFISHHPELNDYRRRNSPFGWPGFLYAQVYRRESSYLLQEMGNVFSESS